MIKLLDVEAKEVTNLIDSDIFQNIYLYIDTKTYGYNNDFIKTFVIKNGEQVTGILLHYYNSLQIFITNNYLETDIIDIAKHIQEYDFEMISGVSHIIEKIYEKIKDTYLISSGVVLKKTTEVTEYSGKTTIAKLDEYAEIAALICTDKSIGGHYTKDLLTEQLKERSLNQNCKNLVIKEDGKIVSHMATYADSPRIAVLAGLITDVSYRGRGYGKTVLNDLTRMIQLENKTPVLYCYNESTISWYQALGWEKINISSKLEKRK